MLQEIVCGFFIAIGLIAICGFIVCLTLAIFMKIFFNAKDKYHDFSKNGKI